MRTIVLKLLCWFCIAATTEVLAYQNTNINSKSAYIDSEWKYKFNTKDNNRYASLLKSSTTQKVVPSKNFKYEITQKPPHRSSYNYINDNPIRLRHSHYYSSPNLDKVMIRLDKMQSTSTTQAPSTTSSPYVYQRQNLDEIDRLFNDKDDDGENLSEDYSNEDDDLPDYDEWDVDENDKNSEDDDDEDEEEEEEDDDANNDWQAEEATEATTSLLTSYKWQHYGTRDRVEESRRLQYPEQARITSEVNSALQHILRMDKQAKCKQPLPRILSVQSLHPDPSKSYMPHCTILHRCAEDTGCCFNQATRCAPKRQNLVDLYFYTSTVGILGSKVEKLSFYNHTECACLNKSSVNTLDAALDLEANLEVSRSHRSRLSTRGGDSLYNYLQPKRCKCPEQYTSRLSRTSTCTCDCTEGNIDCLVIKKGEEHFSLKDRLCISNDKCGLPNCEYGIYMKNKGRCPRIEEKSNEFSNLQSN